jgi:glucose-6-phosphate dehydrogenase assembly protein OpcA
MPTTIDPVKILRELNQLWTTLSREAAAGASDGVLRACAMTLIVLTKNPPADPALTETIASLMRVHPSRAIAIRLADGASRDLGASVNAHCWKPFGSRQQICCEIVEISAAQPALPDLPAVLRGLTAPDLPVILWLHQPELLDSAPLDIGDKLIVDTAGVPDANQALAKVGALAGTGRVIADLSWTRLTRWRETVAHIFANPARQSKLGAIERVTLSCAGDAIPVRGLYLAAWLEIVLGKPQSCRFECATHPAASPHIQRVVLEGPGIDISVELLDNETAELRLDHLRIRESFAVPTEYDLLREELSILGRDRLYEAVLRRARDLTAPEAST